MTCVVIDGPQDEYDRWVNAFAEVAPDLTIRHLDDDLDDPADITFGLVWRPDGKKLAALPHLRALISQGAGVDGILSDPDVPRTVPLYRMGGTEIQDQMGDYVCWAALTLLRETWRWARGQATSTWEHITTTPKTAGQVTVGIMGLGQLGRASALRLHAVGFQAAGWGRRPTTLENVKTFHGPEGFDAFLADADIVVNLLPSTPETHHILNRERFARMKPGSGVINVGRGAELNESDLVAAIRSGHLSGAVLDVFAQEPLPASSPLWTCPGVTISPHLASNASHSVRARHILAIINDVLAGREPPLRVDTSKGY